MGSIGESIVNGIGGNKRTCLTSGNVTLVRTWWIEWRIGTVAVIIDVAIDFGTY